jgi:hypothetical protein
MDHSIALDSIPVRIAKKAPKEGPPSPRPIQDLAIVFTSYTLFTHSVTKEERKRIENVNVI